MSLPSDLVASRRRRLGLIVTLVVVVLCVGAAIRSRIEETANQRIIDANNVIARATSSALHFQAKAREVDRLLTNEVFQHNRSKLKLAAYLAEQSAGESGNWFEEAAEMAQRAIDLTRQDDVRRLWVVKRKSLLSRAEAAKASQSGYAVIADESIADLATLRARMEPFAQRAEKAKAEADRLNAEAEKLPAENRGKF